MGKPFGSMKSTGGGGVGARSATTGFENFLANGINQGTFGGGNFGSAINSMLQGRVGDPNSLNQYFANVQGGNGGLNPGQFMVGSQYAPAQYQNFNALPPGAISVDPNQSRVADSFINSGFGTTANLGSAGSADVNGAFGQAVQQILSRQQDRGVADLRARYGAAGSGLGSNAQFAESNYRAENTPQVAAALGQINQQERGLNLQQRAQDLQNFYSGRQADISQMGQMLGNNQLSGQLGLQAQGMNLDALMQMNQLMQNQNQFQNQFNMNNAQNSAQFGQQANMFNAQNMLQNQQMQNQFGLGQAQVGLGLQQNQQQAQQFAIQQMMQALMQNQGLNTAQRQQYYQPGYVQQGLGVAGQIAGIAGQFTNPFAGMMGGAGNMITNQYPQIQSTPMNTSGAGYNSPMPLVVR